MSGRESDPGYQAWRLAEARRVADEAALCARDPWLALSVIAERVRREARWPYEPTAAELLRGVALEAELERIAAQPDPWSGLRRGALEEAPDDRD